MREYKELEQTVTDTFERVLKDNSLSIRQKIEQVYLDRIGLLECRVCLSEFKPVDMIQVKAKICSGHCAKLKYM